MSVACGIASTIERKMNIHGLQATYRRLFNENINIVVSNFGGSLNSVFVKDKNGQYNKLWYRFGHHQ